MAARAFRTLRSTRNTLCTECRRRLGLRAAAWKTNLNLSSFAHLLGNTNEAMRQKEHAASEQHSAGNSSEALVPSSGESLPPERQRPGVGWEDKPPKTPFDALKRFAEESAVSNEVLRTVHEMPEWKEYDSEVSFELNLLRWQYSASGQKMTPARRAQMQAHAAQLQDKIMSEHAELAAKKYVASLTVKERKELRRVMNRLDPNAAAGMAPRSDSDIPKSPSERVRQEDVGKGIRWSEDGYLQAPAPPVDPGEAMLGLQRAMLSHAEQSGRLQGKEAESVRRTLDAKEEDVRAQKEASRRFDQLPLSQIPSPGPVSSNVPLTDGRQVRAEDVQQLLARAQVLSRVSGEFKKAEHAQLDARLQSAVEEAWAEGGAGEEDGDAGMRGNARRKEHEAEAGRR